MVAERRAVANPDVTLVTVKLTSWESSFGNASAQAATAASWKILMHGVLLGFALTPVRVQVTPNVYPSAMAIARMALTARERSFIVEVEVLWISVADRWMLGL
jgi:hypothetical protein